MSRVEHISELFLASYFEEEEGNCNDDSVLRIYLNFNCCWWPLDIIEEFCDV